MAKAKTVAVTDDQPKPKSNHNGERDEFGFGVNTVGAFVMAHLMDGITRDDLFKTYCSTEFTGWGRGQETRRTKTSLSVFLSDVKKPFGQYHAARSLIIYEDPETHKLTLDRKRVGAIKRAVAAGILEDLKGLNTKVHLDKIKVIRQKHGVPVE